MGPGNLTDQEGKPAAPVHALVLIAIESALAAKGLTALVGTERGMHDARPRPRATLRRIPGRPTGIRTSLTVGVSRRAGGRRERAGLSVEQIHTEYGHDQLEVSLARPLPSPRPTPSRRPAS
jgi:glutamine synthetase